MGISCYWQHLQDAAEHTSQSYSSTLGVRLWLQEGSLLEKGKPRNKCVQASTSKPYIQVLALVCPTHPCQGQV